MARITGAVAKNESDVKSARVRRQKEQAAEQGRVSGGGTRAYGYDASGLVIVESEADIVQEAVRRTLAGESVRGICTDLNERGVPTSTGGQWSPQTLRRMLMSGRISGQRDHKGEVVGDAIWPGIISQSEGERVRALLGDAGRRTNKSARRYLLVRLLRCEHCGEYLVSAPRGDGTRRYGCRKGAGYSGCGKTFINAEPLEQFLVYAMFARLDTRELADAIAQRQAEPDADRWQQEADAAMARREELSLAYGNGEITMVEWRAAREPIEQCLTIARKQLASISHTTVLDGFIGDAAALEQAWESLDLSRQRAILSTVLDHVVVGPARRGYNRFDESRLRPVWRF